MWFPLVMTCTPTANNSRATSGVTPNPPAAFSALAMTKSTPRSRTSFGTCRATVFRPGSPTISPMNRIFIYTRPRRDAAFSRFSLRNVHVAALADHRDFNLARIRELLLDLTGKIPRQHGALGVRNRLLFHDHPDLPP